MDDKPNTSAVWQALQSHFSQISDLKVKDQFASDPDRFSKFSLEVEGIFLDYSKNRVTSETMELLFDLAKKAEVAKYRDDMFGGKKINFTEKLAVLHTALRDVNGNSLPESELVRKELKRIEECVNRITSGKWVGYSGKKITDIVNIGIGGSNLGPRMVVKALKPYANHLDIHFVSNVDGTSITEAIKYLNPETTLFVIASKSFTTQETITNANTAREWLLSKATGDKNAIKQHLLAVTAKPNLAKEFGVPEENIFPFWDWVGGRFSLWSAIGITIALAFGMDKFYELLEGAYVMDQHFKTAPIDKNMPVILALLSIWNNNFLGADTQSIVVYDQYLSLFPTYLQQLEMESNGKHVCIDGSKVKHKTSPVVWGGVGVDSQHSFHQLLMQGTQIVPVDFIIPLKTHNPIGNHHLLLYAHCLAQSKALMYGKTEEMIRDELAAENMAKEDIDKLAPHKVIVGNVPSNTILLNKVEPKTLGALIALYEHKVFVQGVIWQINSFDQWGVQLGKKIAGKLVPMLKGEAELTGIDGSTKSLVERGQAGFSA